MKIKKKYKGFKLRVVLTIENEEELRAIVGTFGRRKPEDYKALSDKHGGDAEQMQEIGDNLYDGLDKIWDEIKGVDYDKC